MIELLKILIPSLLTFLALLFGVRAKRLGDKANKAIAALDALKEHQVKQEEREKKEKQDLDELEEVETDEEAVDFFNKFVGRKK